MARFGKEWNYGFGPFFATITGKAWHRGAAIQPHLRISVSEGPGLLDYSDIHCSKAKTVRTLKRRLERFAMRHGHTLQC